MFMTEVGMGPGVSCANTEGKMKQTNKQKPTPKKESFEITSEERLTGPPIWSIFSQNVTFLSM